MRKIRVLLLMHELSPTGAPKVALSAFERFTSDIELRTLSYLGGPLATHFHAIGSVQILVSRGWPGMSAPLGALLSFAWNRLLSQVKALWWAWPLRRWKPDVIYINSVAGLLVARRLRLPAAPVLLHVHELDEILAAFTQHSSPLLQHLPSRYIAVSQSVSEALTERYQIPTEKVVVIPAFVAEPLELPLLAVRRDARFVVGGAGVINWCKGEQLWLLMAFELKRRLGPENVRFVWVGVPDNEKGWQFREMARKLSLIDEIEFVPFTPRPQDYFKQFDLFALTSWEESASLAAMENMLLEKPVVCFAGTGGPCEFVGDAGVVIAEFSPPDMAAAIAELASDPNRRAALGKSARRRVLENFTAAHQAPNILEEIRRLASKIPVDHASAEVKTSLKL
jgi:glycosyltransferase involved in cell wall biosynthesis